MAISELSDIESIVLECLRDAKARGKPTVDAERAVQYAASRRIFISKHEASHTLSKLASTGLARRFPRAQRGWGLSWEVCAYEIMDSASRSKP
ncbi:MAG TPA: hypothetical protein VED40_07745 [Azospirillaceae bacterium]|nr:hypothetical protein [Azospirillaceae bacterium]